MNRWLFRVHGGQLGALLFLALSVICLFGCGGGTRGTGDTRSLSGSILSQSGEPLSGATVSQAETGVETETAADGGFVIPLTVIDGGATLIIERGDLRTSTTLDVSTVSPEEPIPSVSITVDTLTGVVVAVEFETEPAPDPTPTPRPDEPNPTPRPEGGHTIRGVAVDGSGDGASDAVISIAGEDSDRTDEDGRFLLKTKTPMARITFKVRYQQAQGTFSVSGLPTNRAVTVSIKVTLRVTSDPNDTNGGPPERLLTGTVDSITIR